MDNQVNPFEDSQEAVPVTAGGLASVQEAASKFVELQAEVRDLEEKLKAKQAEFLNQETRVLPDAMEAAGFREFVLMTGEKITIAPVIRASITEANQEKAFSWMVDNGHEDLIKRDVTVNFGRGSYKEADDLVEALKEDGFTPKDKTYVHWQTLNAFVKEQVESGAELPMDLLGVYVGRKAKVVTK